MPSLEKADQLKELVYVIKLSDWNISNDGTNASDTTNGINRALAWASSENYTTCILPRGTYLIAAGTSMDATNGGIEIPSGMTFFMVRNAILKVKPNGSFAYNAIRMNGKSNITVRGGEIHGDRYAHDFSKASTPSNRSTHEWGYGIHIKASENIIIDDVKIKNCTGDCAMISSKGLMGGEKYTPSTNIKIQNCVFDSARRNNISITGCDNVIIQNNSILNAGINDGTAPRYGIDIEGYGEGEIDYQEPENIVIKNNRFKGNVNGSLLNYNGYGVIIEGNISDNTISYGYGTETIVSGNILKNPIDGEKIAISGNAVSKGKDGNNVTITGNIILGFKTGIDARGKDIVITGNQIKNCLSEGIGTYSAENILITGNSISNSASGNGIKILLSKSVTFSENKISAIGNIAIRVMNSSEIDIFNNKINYCKQSIKMNDSDVHVKGNVINQESYPSETYAIMYAGKSSVIVEHNTIKSPNLIAIYAANIEGSSKIINNTIENSSAITAILCVNMKHEVLENLISVNRTSTNGQTIIVKSSNGSIIMSNKIYSISAQPSYHIVTNTSINSKIIANILFGGAILSNASDQLTENVIVAVK